jgi:glycerophosphoryl diester phosphodiesterase
MRSPTSLVLPGKNKPYVMAHRGNRALCPENTLSSFQRALQDGADIIETDLHLTADGVLVCIHDATVDRTTDGHGFVSEKTLQELKRLNAAHHWPAFSPQQILTLVEVAALIPPDAALALELKTDRFLEPEICLQLVKELQQIGIYDRSVVLSFSEDRIRTVKTVAPEIPIGLISMSRYWPASGVELMGPFWPILITNPFYVKMAHKRGELVCPLDPTPDSRLWIYKWSGCDAILTDNPAATCARLRG